MTAYRTSAAPPNPVPQKVSRLWLVIPWLTPEWAVRWLPPWITDNVERCVYDGLTRAEWVEEQVRQIETSARAEGWTDIKWGTPTGSKDA